MNKFLPLLLFIIGLSIIPENRVIASAPGVAVIATRESHLFDIGYQVITKINMCFIEWQTYVEGMVFEDYSTQVYIKVKDDQGREFIRNLDLTILT